MTDTDEDGESSGEEAEEPQVRQPAVPRAIRERIAQDDAEIADLERKLGLKGRKTLPKSFDEDGLGDILADIDGVGGATTENKKRKAEADEWLAEKRRKASRGPADGNGGEGEGKGNGVDDDSDTDDFDGFGEEDDDDLGKSGSDDGLDESDSDGAEDSDEDLSGFDSDEEVPSAAPARVRENPYVAPTTGVTVAKYVPPSRRQEQGSDAELVQRLRRQLQGLVNRITESNLLSIIGDIEKVYREQPRQHVTSILVDLVLVQVCDPTSLPDTLLILSAGFTTALFKIIGMDFGAQLVQDAVDRFDQYYKRAVSAPDEASKETSNIITFLAELYNFQLIGCNLIFDYIRLLLTNLSELDAELLLRIIRLSGHSLRQDDPSSLKDIVALIRPAVSKVGENNISVRTKFMIETINDLKNNRMKTGLNASAIVSEHTIRMKKLLGSLNTRKLKSTEPLRMGLSDIQDAEKKGKWWLVGASWAGRSNQVKAASNPEAQTEGEDGDSDSDSDIVMGGGDGGAPDLAELAREQMMNTDVRRSIFVAILSATDYEDAYVRLRKLRLNKDRQREIANVILQCAGAEQQYNPYYTLVAKRLCSDRKNRWSFQDSLWRLFRRLGESIFGDEAEEVDDDDTMEMRRLVNIAKMYGILVQDGALGLGILKCLSLPYLQAKARAFVEVLLITALLECSKAEKAGQDDTETAIGRMVASLKDAPELSRGLQWFIKKVIRKSDLAGSKGDAKKLKSACTMADRALEAIQLAEVVDDE